MATNYIGAGTFVANTTITAFLGVVLSSNRGVGLSTSTACDGFALVDGASGDYVSVAFLTNNGTLKGTIGAAPVTVGDTIYLASSGQVSTTGTVTIGKALTTTSTTGAVIEFLPKNV
jgi:hypothetical protein